ncbi:MAG: HAMP domain-containing histidine kinase [Betaproteobacteria bacterium]|nr:HAMP domain-containing histidine kinase [Betaproteobacteria bacterium]
MATDLSKKLLRSSRWLLFAMLASLSFALWLEVDSIWSRPLLIIHFGLFLLWQPLWRGEHELRLGGVVFIVCIGSVVLLWLNWWLLTFWVGGLFALVGGRVFAYRARWARVLYLSVMAYLLAALLLWVVPHLFGLSHILELQGIHETASSLMSVVFPLLLTATLFMPVESEQSETVQAVDFFYSLLLFLLLTQLVLGSLSFMTLGHVDYLEALLRTLFVMALVLLALGWLWNPRFGFTGLQPVFSRYLLNIGTPFESWLRQLAETAQHEQSPAAFLAQATTDLAALPWLSGVTWRAEEDSGHLGESSPHYIEVEEQGLRLTLFSRQAIAPSVLLHIHLLTQLLGYFYQAKRREQRLREVTRLQAIYETGARLTHDLKNMLQSLLGLTSIAQHREEEVFPLLRRQLPVLVQRIEMTLSKLKVPQLENESSQLPLAAWWENLRQRHQHAAIIWVCKGAATDEKIPAALFDCVADNLIDNARNKRLQQPDVCIRVTLSVQPFFLDVCDSGNAIPAPLAHQLLQTVVPSENGLGVGLYQAARWAGQLGYQLVLRENVEGAVCFELLQNR